MSTATFGQAVRGIQDLRFAASGASGGFVDLGGVKGLSVDVTADSDEQRGDDEVLFIVQEGKTLDISVTSALANLEVLGLLTDSAAVTSGAAPNQVVTFRDPAQSATRYVQIVAQGQGRDASGSALRMTIPKAQLTEGPNWQFEEGSWLEPELTLTGVGDNGFLYEVAAYETAESLDDLVRAVGERGGRVRRGEAAGE